jgi:sugar O-acyltransferase (sialic acid O-acetyltransferase NeuD family)
MIKRIGIFGTSGMALEVRDIAETLGITTFFVTQDSKEINSNNNTIETVNESDIYKFKDASFVIGIGDNIVRKKIAMRYTGKVNFTNLIHPTASFGYDQRNKIEKKQGVIVCAGVRFTHNILIGDFTIFNVNSTISHDSVISDFVTISPQACILGNVEVGTGVLIGAHATINQGKNECKRKIGSNTIIGSGAVVLDDCDSDSVYAGVPAKKIK